MRACWLVGMVMVMMVVVVVVPVGAVGAAGAGGRWEASEWRPADEYYVNARRIRRDE